MRPCPKLSAVAIGLLLADISLPAGMVDPARLGVPPAEFRVDPCQGGLAELSSPGGRARLDA